MPVAFRRLYGWDEENERWIPVLVDPDGNLLASSDSDAEDTVGNITFQRVSDLNTTEVLGDILTQLKIMNTHLQIITDEEIK